MCHLRFSKELLVVFPKKFSKAIKKMKDNGKKCWWSAYNISVSRSSSNKQLRQISHALWIEQDQEQKETTWRSTTFTKTYIKFGLNISLSNT